MGFCSREYSLLEDKTEQIRAVYWRRLNLLVTPYFKTLTSPYMPIQSSYVINSARSQLVPFLARFTWKLLFKILKSCNYSPPPWFSLSETLPRVWQLQCIFPYCNMSNKFSFTEFRIFCWSFGAVGTPLKIFIFYWTVSF